VGRRAKLTVGALRRAMEGLSDDVAVVIDDESHRYQPAGDAIATTALVDDDEWYEDSFSGSSVGEQTEHGTRVAVLRINDV
jgi:hypothetical protein